MNTLIKDKLIALSVHLMISLAIALTCWLIIGYIWYPDPLFKATGGWHIFLIMLSVDIVLGPILTFIVFKKGKKTLKMDLIIIAILQLGAILYGMHSMYQGRPVWIGYVLDRFELIRANDVIEEKDVIYDLPKFGPEYRYIDIKPKDANMQFDLIYQEAVGRISPASRPKLHKDFSLANEAIKNHVQSLQNLEQFNSKDAVTAILSKYPKANGFIPMKATELDMTVLVNKDNGEVIKVVDLRPWK